MLKIFNLPYTARIAKINAPKGRVTLYTYQVLGIYVVCKRYKGTILVLFSRYGINESTQIGFLKFIKKYSACLTNGKKENNGREGGRQRESKFYKKISC